MTSIATPPPGAAVSTVPKVMTPGCDLDMEDGAAVLWGSKTGYSASLYVTHKTLAGAGAGVILDVKLIETSKPKC